MRKPHPSKTYLLGLALAGALFASTAGHAQQPPAKSDSVHANDWAWMEKAARAGAFEVQAGQIASAKATNPKVREFADKMVAELTERGYKASHLRANMGDLDEIHSLFTAVKEQHDAVGYLPSVAPEPEPACHLLAKC